MQESKTEADALSILAPLLSQMNSRMEELRTDMALLKADKALQKSEPVSQPPALLRSYGIPELTPLRVYSQARRPLQAASSQPPAAARALFGDVLPSSQSLPSVTPAAAEPSTDPAAAGLRLRNVKVPQPDKFSGTAKEKATSRSWLSAATDWLRLTVGDQSEDIKVMYFGTVLSGQARAWFDAEKLRAEAAGQHLTLAPLFANFLDAFAESRSVIALQQEMEQLRFGVGKCTNLIATETHFDALAFTIYGTVQPKSDADMMLGAMYGNVIKHGDLELWAMATDELPSGLSPLADWKEAVQTAAAKLKNKAGGASRRGGPGRSQGQWRTGGSTWTEGRQHNASVNNVNAREAGGDNEDIDEETSSDGAGGRAEGQSASAAEVHSRQSGRGRGVAQGRGRGRGAYRGRAGPGSSNQLTEEQRDALMAAERCFICYEKGHIARGCKQKRSRAPTEEELNA
ncbi:MAG: hypothetical protein ACRD45_06070 [Bryobacteraceae bacterium]